MNLRLMIAAVVWLSCGVRGYFMIRRDFRKNDLRWTKRDRLISMFCILLGPISMYAAYMESSSLDEDAKW